MGDIPHLDNKVDEMKVYAESYGKYWDEYGCTLMCDGWSTQNRRKIINFLVYSTYGTVFLKSVDATDKFQNADYICSLMDDMVKIIGESRVVQVITDNGANYKKAGQQLMLVRKHLYWTPCAAHCIDLIFLDMSKDDGVNNIVHQCQQLTGFIYNHGWVLSLMRRETQNRELIRPAITRFATHFIALESIYLHRDDLRRMITAREWAEKYPRLSTKDKKSADDVYRMILSDEFWKDIASIIVVFEPLVKVLRLVDSDDKADMGYLYEAMDRAKEAIKKNVGRDYKKWWGIIDRRWDRQLHQDIHAAGYFLNPRFQYSSNATVDNEVLSGFKHVVERMEPDVMKQLDIHKEMFSDLRCSPSCNCGGALAAEPFCSPDCFRYKGALDVMYKVVSQEGFSRLWRGTNASLVLAVPTVGIYLPCYDIFRNWIEEFTSQHAPKLTPYAPLVAGSVARSLACVACSPIELARTRMQAFKEFQAGTKPPGMWKTLIGVQSPFKTTKYLENVQGYRILWTGVGAQLARDVPFSAICWSTLEPIRRKLLEIIGEDGNAASVLAANFSAGFLAGSLAAAATCPLDVAKTRRQIEKDPQRALDMTTRKTLMEVWRDGGTKGLFTGVGPRVVRAGPSVGIVVSFYEVVKYVLHQRHKNS